MTDVGSLGPDLSPRRHLSSEELHAITDDLKAFADSDDQHRTLELPDGSSLELSKDPDAPEGVRISKDGQVFPPMGFDTFHAAERPPGYPDDVPFISDAMTHVTHLPGRGLFSAIWMMVADPQAVFTEVEAWHLEHGWAQVGDPPDQNELLQQARGRMAETMTARGLSEEEAAKAVEAAMETFRNARRVRLAQGDATRGISVMAMPDGRGTVTLFARPTDTGD